MSLEHSYRLAGNAEKIDAMSAARRDVITADQMIDGEYPVFASRAKGTYLWDVDDNRYIDFFLSYGTVILGHADDRVDDRVIEELRTGFATGLMKPLQLELARELTDLIPGAEMAMFMRTGSDATGSAVRLARSFTGRERVVRWGYNGWHDWCAQWDRGIPTATRSLVHTFAYNDLDSLRAVFERYPGEIACVLMMPFLIEAPEPGFLEGVKRLTSEHGALLVFDEMRSGFRIAAGGAQEFFDVTADLATFSKGLANGYSISALLGRADVLSHLSKVHISSTFYVNTLEMAAALATVRTLRSGPHLSHVWSMGERLQAGLREAVTEFGVPARVVGYPPMPFLEFDMATPEETASVKRIFFTETIRSGVFFHPSHHWFVCAAATEDDIDYAIEASRRGFEAVARCGLPTR